uniref:RUN domain-containing protein n=1 Tax=Macrostomum lignano TaxID=282301 RepID=A0A1I8FM37_9PLAT
GTDGGQQETLAETGAESTTAATNSLGLGYSEYTRLKPTAFPAQRCRGWGDKFWGRELLVGRELSKKRGLLACGRRHFANSSTPQQKQPTDSASVEHEMSHRLLPKFVSSAASRFQRSESEPAAHRTEEALSNGGAEIREALLRHVKREVKQLMEESVARKFIHEESSVITQLCACSPGVFRENSTLALLHRVAKSCQPAKHVLDRLAADAANGGQTGGGRQRKSSKLQNPSAAPQPAKFHWIRVALLEKRLAKIVEYLVEQGKQLYEANSIIADPCDGPLLASLLVGPVRPGLHQGQVDELRLQGAQHRGAASAAPQGLADAKSGARRRPIGASLRVLRHLYSSRLAGDLSTTSSSSALAAPVRIVELRRARAAAITASAADNLLLLHQVGRAALLYAKNGVVSQAGGQSLETSDPAICRCTPLRQPKEPRHCPLTPASTTQFSSPSDVESSLLSNRSAVATRRQDSADGHQALGGSLSHPSRRWCTFHCHGDGGGGGSLVFVARDGTPAAAVALSAAAAAVAAGDNPAAVPDKPGDRAGAQRLAGPPLWTQCGRRGSPGRNNRERAVERACL